MTVNKACIMRHLWNIVSGKKNIMGGLGHKKLNQEQGLLGDEYTSILLMELEGHIKEQSECIIPGSARNWKWRSNMSMVGPLSPSRYTQRGFSEKSEK